MSQAGENMQPIAESSKIGDATNELTGLQSSYMDEPMNSDAATHSGFNYTEEEKTIRK